MTLAHHHTPVEQPLVQCCPSLARRLITWLPAQWNASRFRDVRTFLLFIGYPRSGHTLIGSLLNAHRNMLVGHELNVMHYVKRHFSRSQIYWMLHQQDAAFNAAGCKWTSYDYQVPGQWQGKCESLQVIGDKHGNGASTLLRMRPDVLPRLRKTVGVPVKMLHILRHPLDNIATMSRKYQIAPQEAAETYFSLCEVNQRLMNDPANDLLAVHLEDFIAQPRPELLRIVSFLGQLADVGYLNDCASIVFPEPKQSRHAIEWPSDTLQFVKEQAGQYSFLERYGLAEAADSVASDRRRAA